MPRRPALDAGGVATRNGWREVWLDAWLDLVAGGSCVGCRSPGRPLCPACSESLPRQGHPVRPTPCPDGLAPCFAAGEYAEVLRTMILAHKEHSVLALARPLGRVLAGVAQPLLPPPGSLSVLVPVPSRPGVVRRRGHDPMARVTAATVRRLRGSGADVALLPLLRVTGAIADQAGLSAAARAANLAGSMRVRPGPRTRLARSTAPVSIFVCDDVLTTGATAREAQRALEVAGLPVRGILTVAATRRRLPPATPDGGPPPLPLSGFAD